MYSVTIRNMIFSFLIADQQLHDQQQQQYRFAPQQQQQQQQQQSRLNDPAIMSASFGVPLASPQDAFGHTEQAFGPPTGLAYSAGLQSSVVNDGEHFFLLFLRGRPTFGIPSVAPLGQDLFHYA